ncbi:MAG: glycine cleavage system aminomethyltransferase GcvT [Chloroflexia bacterium]|nr:glycine cleavage system aminomethyltransferase GcvT [Chloroflexia bacterium]
MAKGEGVEDQDESLKQTALLDRHKALGARIVPFAGWEMPVQYEGILAEHRAVRSVAGLFDLGHMGQVEISGPDALDFLQYTTTNDVGTLEPGEAKYGLLPNERGGVVDDIIVYRNPEGQDGYMVCVNASNTDKDVAWWRELRDRRSDLDVTVRDISPELGMIAIQGPTAVTIVKRVTDAPVDDIEPFSWRIGTIAGVEIRIARTGYTGEDGFEFYASNDQIGQIWDALMEAGTDLGIQPIGLGARDTLRLEARMPLYGQELDDDISPYEAGLGWAVSLTKGDFVGRDEMEKLKSEGPKRRTVGFTTVGRTGAPRSHCPVALDGEEIGVVTSGTYSPTLEKNIGLALIEREYAGVGKPLQIIVRGKPVEAVQVKTPFYKRDR